jgi:hypothetical protein
MEVTSMQKANTIAAIAVVLPLTLFVLCSAAPALALVPGLYVNPGTLPTPGGSTTITLVTPLRATGTLKVKCVGTGEEWLATVDTGSTGTQTWTFPSNSFVGLTPPNTNTMGMYDVVADIIMNVSTFKWKTTFMVEFFVIPVLPLGTLMAVVACFGAVGGYIKLRHASTKRD